MVVKNKNFNTDNYILCKTDCYETNPELLFLILLDCSMLL
jgi:hypothetical protein